MRYAARAPPGSARGLTQGSVTVEDPGAARNALEKLSAARPARVDLDLLSRDASALVTDRHVLMHSVAMRDIEDSGGPGAGIWSPLKNAETRITAPQVLDHARSIRILTREVGS